MRQTGYITQDTCRIPQPRQGIWPFFMNVLNVRRQRKALADLTPEHLDDIGISKAEAEREAKKFIWDVPNHWMK